MAAKRNLDKEIRDNMQKEFYEDANGNLYSYGQKYGGKDKDGKKYRIVNGKKVYSKEEYEKESRNILFD